MECRAGFHAGNVRSLLGSISTAVDDPLCLPDPVGTSLFDELNRFGKAVVDDPGEYFEQFGTTVGLAAGQAVLGAAEFVVPAVLSGGASIPASLAGYIVSHADPELRDEVKIAQQVYSLGSNLSVSGDDIMSIFDGFSFDSIVDFASDIIDDVNFGNVLEIATPFATSLVSGGNRTVQAVPAMAPVRQAASAAAGAIARVGPTVGRSFFNKFPNLAVKIQQLRNAGQNVSRSKLYSMMRRFGPEFMVSAGLLSAAAVSELILAGPGHRRMNVGNVKALRRGMRRIEGFHKLCSKADRLRRPKARVTAKVCR